MSGIEHSASAHNVRTKVGPLAMSKTSRLPEYLSLATLKIVGLVYVPAFVLALLWFCIPLHHTAGLVVAVFIQWFLQYFAWMVFFDFIWPNCPKRFLFTSLALYIALSSLAIWLIYYLNNADNKGYFLLLALVELLCSSGCYVFHIFRTRLQIRSRNERLIRSKSEKIIVKEEHWSRWFYNTFYRLSQDDLLARWFSKQEMSPRIHAYREERDPESEVSMRDFATVDNYQESADANRAQQKPEQKKATPVPTSAPVASTATPAITTTPAAEKKEGEVAVDVAAAAETKPKVQEDDLPPGEVLSPLPQRELTPAEIEHRAKEIERAESTLNFRVVDQMKDDESPNVRESQAALPETKNYLIAPTPVIEHAKSRTRLPTYRKKEDAPVSSEVQYLGKWGLRTMLVVILFKVFWLVSWIVFFFFTDASGSFVRRLREPGGELNLTELSKDVRESLAAVVNILLFNIFRVLLYNLLLFLNRLLPSYLEAGYFATFTVQIWFYAYYRTLFLSYQDWVSTVVLNVFLAIIEFYSYPLMMTKFAWVRKNRIRNAVKRCLSCLKGTKLQWVYDSVEPQRFEPYIEQLAVEYFHQKNATYVSIFFFAAYLVVFHFGTSVYNCSFYPSFNLSRNDFLQLMYRLVYLLLFEFVVDVLIRTFTYVKLGINIGALGRNSGSLFLRIRALFSVFLISLWISVFFSFAMKSDDEIPCAAL